MLSSSHSGTLDDEWGDEGRSTYRCCRFSAVSVALSFSLMTMFTGLSLLILSLQKQREASDLDSQTGLNVENMNVDAMREYWLQLVGILIPTTEIVIPDSPVYKALQWMVLRDPWRPFSDEARIRQRFTLSVLYFSWSGPSWALPDGSGWLREAMNDESLFNECSWEGIECNAEDEVIGIDLDDELFPLGGGTIPTQLGHLTALQTLGLVRQGLRGRIPSEVAQLKNLVVLNLPSNRLSGIDLSTIPMDNLELLRLSDNLIQGRVDFELLQKASNLRVLELHQNKGLEGNAFSIITNFTLLESVDLSTTSIEGTIPEDIGRLTNLKILNFQLKDPSPLPTSIGQCTSLEQFLSGQPDRGAGLVGGLPSEIGGLTELQILDIRNNINLGSTIPTELGLLTNLVRVEVKRSSLEGTLPTELGELSNLQVFLIESNPITGTVPTEYGRLTSLELLQLVGTEITGKMPQEICELDMDRLVASCKGYTFDAEAQFSCVCCTTCLSGA
eukprot:scaffold1771_cov172-Amphora_coffeaeformis.AAC.3